MLPLLYLVFVLSGAAGLIYESIWTRYLGLFVGHSAYAQVIVLVIFLGGMSLGALLIGRRTERLTRPLFWYAIVEFATGMIGLVFHDIFVATTNFTYASIFPSVGLGAAQPARCPSDRVRRESADELSLIERSDRARGRGVGSYRTLILSVDRPASGGRILLQPGQIRKRRIIRAF